MNYFKINSEKIFPNDIFVLTIHGNDVKIKTHEKTFNFFLDIRSINQLRKLVSDSINKQVCWE